MSIQDVALSKKCNRCGNEYPATTEFFRKRSRGKYGLQGQCKNCQREQERAQRATPEGKAETYRRNHTPEREAYMREYGKTPQKKAYMRTYSCLEPTKERDRQRNKTKKRLDWRRQNASKHNQRRRERYASDPMLRARCAERNRSEKHREYKRKYYQTKHGHIKYRIYRQQRLARANSVTSALTDKDWQRALEYFGHRCAVCGCAEDEHIVLAQDHWIPLSRGGNYTADNIVPLCHFRRSSPPDRACCNPSKGNKKPGEWLSRIGEQGKEIADRVEEYFSWTKSPQSKT